jgi:hypothetical protein
LSSIAVSRKRSGEAASTPGGRKRVETLITALIVTSAFGYPMLGTIVAFTDADALVASIPVRLAVLTLSVLLYLAKRSNSNNIPGLIVQGFWLLYVVRLAWDLFVADIPGTAFDLTFFVATGLIPAFALLNTQRAEWRRDRAPVLRLGEPDNLWTRGGGNDHRLPRDDPRVYQGNDAPDPLGPDGIVYVHASTRRVSRPDSRAGGLLRRVSVAGEGYGHASFLSSYASD